MKRLVLLLTATAALTACGENPATAHMRDACDEVNQMIQARIQQDANGYGAHLLAANDYANKATAAAPEWKQAEQLATVLSEVGIDAFVQTDAASTLCVEAFPGG